MKNKTNRAAVQVKASRIFSLPILNTWISTVIWIYTSDAPTPINRFLRVKCMPRQGESFVLKFVIIIFVLSVRTPGLCVTLTSSKLQSEVNFEKFHSVILQSTDAEARTLLKK